MKINPYLQNINKINGEASSAKNEKMLSAQSNGYSSQLKEMGVSSSAEMQAAYRIYKSSQNEPTKTTMQQTQSFLEKMSGSAENKLLTVQVASAKGVEITESNLTDIHNALNDQGNETMAMASLLGEEYSEAEGIKVSEDAAPEVVSKVISEEVSEAIKKLPEALKKQVYAAIKEMGFTEEESVEIGNKLLSGQSVGSILSEQQGKEITKFTSDVLKKLSEKNATAPQNLLETLMVLEGKIKISLVKIKMNVQTPVEGLENLVELTKELSWASDSGKKASAEKGKSQRFSEQPISDGTLGNVLKNTLPINNQGSEKTANMKTPESIVSQDVVQKTNLEDAAQEATSKDDSAEVVKSDEAQNLSSPTDFLNQLESVLEDALSGLMSAYGQADVQTLFESHSLKTYLVTEVTVRMVEVKKTFDQFKKETLDAINNTLEKPSARNLAEIAVKVAEKLDHLIMQSDLTLYTDMKTERKLVGLSSDLQKVGQLAKTNPDEAIQCLKDIKKKMDKLLFEPSKEKVQVLLKEKAQSAVGVEQNDLMQKASKMGSGAKGVLDLMRSMGLNHEVELMDAVFSTESVVKNDDTKSNLKQILLKLSAENQEDNQHLIKSIEKGLSQLTGQQLLNKPEVQSDSQSLFFNLPIKLGEDLNQMKLYVKARKDVQKMDWENCSMYFLIDLKQYGETGIRIQSNQKQLSISVSNESDQIMKVIEPFAQEILEELKEIGYNPGDIRYVPFDNIKQVPSELPKVDVKASKEDTLDINNDNLTSRKGFELRI